MGLLGVMHVRAPVACYQPVACGSQLVTRFMQHSSKLNSLLSMQTHHQSPELPILALPGMFSDEI